MQPATTLAEKFDEIVKDQQQDLGLALGIVRTIQDKQQEGSGWDGIRPMLATVERFLIRAMAAPLLASSDEDASLASCVNCGRPIHGDEREDG